MQVQTILVGLDLSAPSLMAARWVANHFAPDARLILVHCIEERWLPRFLEGGEFDALRTDSRRLARETLEEVAQDLGSERTVTVLGEGDKVQALVEAAEEESADLLVVGAHQRRPMLGSALGSTVSRLLSEARVPVLVAHGLPDGPPRRLLAAIDESEVGRRVLEWAAALGQHFDIPGHVLYAIEPPGVNVNKTLFASADEYSDARNRILEEAEKWLRDRMRDAALDRDRFQAGVAYGRPEFEIVSTADRQGSELIVMGTRGRGRAHAMVIGSVARDVLETSACPVLVVPPRRS